MIIVRLNGGMGNQMFQYAIGRALSLKNNTEMGLDLAYLLDRPARHNYTFRDYYLEIFNINPKIVSQEEISFLYRKNFKSRIGSSIQRFLNRIFKNHGVEKHFHFDPKIVSIGPDAYLDGYWQSAKYFNEIEDVIRKDFVLKNPLPGNIQKLVEEIKNQKSLCIHVRRGDVVGNPLNDVIEKDYFKKGIKKIETLTKIDKIYVFSDDIKWCEENLSFSYPTMFVDQEYSGDKDQGNLALMSVCHHFIIPNSTFSWWGAWLSSYKDKIIIAPQKWFNDESIDSSDLIPKEWIRI